MNIFFFFSSRRRHTSFSRDWSSDVCSSDLTGLNRSFGRRHGDVVSRGGAGRGRIGGRGGGDRRGRTGGRGGGGGRGVGGHANPGVADLYRDNRRAHVGGRALRHEQVLDHALVGARQLDDRLGGLDLHDDLVGADLVAWLHQPLDDVFFHQALADVGELELLQLRHDVLSVAER